MRVWGNEGVGELGCGGIRVWGNEGVECWMYRG